MTICWTSLYKIQKPCLFSIEACDIRPPKRILPFQALYSFLRASLCTPANTVNRLREQTRLMKRLRTIIEFGLFAVVWTIVVPFSSFVSYAGIRRHWPSPVGQKNRTAHASIKFAK